MVGVFPQHVLDEDRYEGDLYQLGTAATIVRMATAPDGTVHAILQGVGRIKLLGVEQAEPWIVGRIERLGETVDRSAGLDTLMGEIREGFVRIITLSETLPQELAAAVGNLGDPSALADFIAANLQIRTEQRYAVLEELNVNRRLTIVKELIAHEIEVLEVQSQIQADVRGELDKRQREFILREQMKAIQKELGEGDITPELSELKQRLGEAALPEAAQREADRELQRLTSIPSISPEYQVSRTYLEWLADLPWNTSTEDLLDIIRAEAVLNEDHYGLDKVKRRILDFLAVIGRATRVGQSSASRVRRGRGRRPSGSRSRARWAASSSGCRSAGCGMRPRSAGTGGRMSARCPAGSSRSYGAVGRATRSSCWMRSISWVLIFAATRRPRCLRCWTRRRTRRSRTTTWIPPSTCLACFLWRRPISSTTFRGPCATAWRSSNCPDTPNVRSSRSASAICWAGNSGKTGSRTASCMSAKAQLRRSSARTPARPASGTLSESLGVSAGP